MSLFQKLITETQISNPPKPAMDHNSIKLMVLLPAIAIHFRSFRYETPCITYGISKQLCLLALEIIGIQQFYPNIFADKFLNAQIE